MGETKTAIYYNHNFYYDFSQIISADDRAVQFGDGAYEWIRIHHGHSFGLSYHTDRLYRSMRLLGIRPVTAPDEFTEIVEVVVEESEIEEKTEYKEEEPAGEEVKAEAAEPAEIFEEKEENVLEL